MAKRSSWLSDTGARWSSEPSRSWISVARRAAERHVQFLDAAADGEQRHAALDRPADQRQGRRVAVGIVGAVGLAGVAAIEFRVHVRLRARQHDAVDRVEKLVEVEPVAERRHQHREDTGSRKSPLPDIAAARRARCSCRRGGRRSTRRREAAAWRFPVGSRRPDVASYLGYFARCSNWRSGSPLDESRIRAFRERFQPFQ